MATYDVKEVTLTVEPTENKPPIPQASCSLSLPLQPVTYAENKSESGCGYLVISG